MNIIQLLQSAGRIQTLAAACLPRLSSSTRKSLGSSENPVPTSLKTLHPNYTLHTLVTGLSQGVWISNTQIKRSQENSSEGTRKVLWEVLIGYVTLVLLPLMMGVNIVPKTAKVRKTLENLALSGLWA